MAARNCRFFIVHLQVNKTTGFAGEYRKNFRNSLQKNTFTATLSIDLPVELNETTKVLK